MSIRAVSWALRQPGIQSTEKLTLIALADLADQEGHSWPSIAYLVGVVGVQERRIQRALKQLEAAGLVTRIERRREDRSSRSNLYRVLISDEDIEGGGVVQDTPGCRTGHPGVSYRTPGGVVQDTPLPITNTTKPHSPSESVSKHPSKRAKRPPRRRTLPPDWQPNDSHRARAAAEGIDLERQATLFRNHHEAKANIFANWDKAFTNWLMNTWDVRGTAKASADPSSAKFKRPRTPWAADGTISDEFRSWHDQALRDGVLVEPMDLTITRDQVEGK